jgi:hypothetical protein
MNQSTIAVLFSFALYALYVLLPVLPAVVIYRMFPKTRVAVSGPLSKLSFKASGAFAAYVVTVFLGYSLVNQSLQLIRNMSTPTWRVQAYVNLLDADGNKITSSGLLQALRVQLKPDIVVPAGKYVQVTLSGEPSALPMLIFHVPGFEDGIVNFNETRVKRKPAEGIIEVDEPVELKQPRTPYRANAGEVAVESAGGPPPGM